MTELESEAAMSFTELATFVGAETANGDASAASITTVLVEIGRAAAELADVISLGALYAPLGATVEGGVGGGDPQRVLDVTANEILLAACRRAPVAWFASEELDRPIELDPNAPLAVAVDPLDGSSNIDSNGAIGTIFSIRPADDGVATFARSGRDQLAAGFVVYGPQTTMVFTLGRGTHIAVLDRRCKQFYVVGPDAEIPPVTREYAINASNKRHWPDGIRNYVLDCQAGAAGPRGEDFNTRWIASLVADAYRILMRGGIYLYPGDSRRGYEQGRLRLIYEAHPIALLVEQAGGRATDGLHDVLDVASDQIHVRTPLVFGSRDEVARLAPYLRDAASPIKNAPLFADRGLFRS